MRAFVVQAPEHDVEAASDVLWQLGVRAVEERRSPDADPDADPNAHMVELWTAVGDEPAAIDRAVQALRGRWTHRMVEVLDHDPAMDAWRDFAVPMWVDDDLVVVPAWHLNGGGDGGGGGAATRVWIEPGGAFGLGDHPTTMLSLRALRRLIDGDLDVLDVGCGTGVLAVAAALLQARPVRAIDVAWAAVEATIDNARRNGVEGRVEVDTTDVSAVDGEYDVVVANILAPVLVALADDLRRVTRPGGRLVISGILPASHRHVLDALAPMQVERSDVLDGWACVVLRHPHAR